MGRCGRNVCSDETPAATTVSADDRAEELPERSTAGSATSKAPAPKNRAELVVSIFLGPESVAKAEPAVSRTGGSWNRFRLNRCPIKLSAHVRCRKDRRWRRCSAPSNRRVREGARIGGARFRWRALLRPVRLPWQTLRTGHIHPWHWQGKWRSCATHWINRWKQRSDSVQCGPDIRAPVVFSIRRVSTLFGTNLR